MIPRTLLERHQRARKIVEIGVGQRFDTALVWKEAVPDAQVVVTDIDREALRKAPEELVAVEDDVTEPTYSVYRGADLLYGVRLPEELQVPTAELSWNVDADFAHKPLAGEIADLSHMRGTCQVVQGWDHWRWQK